MKGSESKCTIERKVTLSLTWVTDGIRNKKGSFSADRRRSLRRHPIKSMGDGSIVVMSFTLRPCFKLPVV